MCRKFFVRNFKSYIFIRVLYKEYLRVKIRIIKHILRSLTIINNVQNSKSIEDNNIIYIYMNLII